MTSETLTALLEERASRNAAALIDRGRPVSGSELAAESRRVAAGLAALGIGPGDRVALWLPNVPAWLASLFACARLGAIAVALNTRFASGELADILGRSACKALILWPGFPKADFAGRLAAAGALPALEAIVVYGEGEPLPQTLAGRPAVAYSELKGKGFPDRSQPAAGCALFTTSGTTKAPKFALHTQRSLTRHAFDVMRGFEWSERSTVLLAPPLCGVFGLCTALAAMAAGAPLFMLPAWDAAQAARAIDAHRITHLTATDEALAQLLAQNARTPAFPSLAFAAFGAFNPALGDIVARADARGMKALGLYGTSEIQALFARQALSGTIEERSLAGGRPVSPNAGVRARDPDSGRVLPHGEPGELEFFAPDSCMREYFGDPDATRAALVEGWYRSGDLGYTLADGRFVFVTRMGDSLRLAGFLVSPLEIEAAVQEVPGIRACQAVAVEVQGKPRPVAFVVMDSPVGLDEGAVIAHVEKKLAKYKVPVRVFAVDAFPTTPGANATKIQKHKLRELALSRMTSD